MRDYTDFSLLLAHKESFEWEGLFKIPDAIALPMDGCVFIMSLRQSITHPEILRLTSPDDVVVASVNDTDKTIRLRFFKPKSFTNLLFGSYLVSVDVSRGEQYVVMGRGKLEIETSLNR